MADEGVRGDARLHGIGAGLVDLAGGQHLRHDRGREARRAHHGRHLVGAVVAVDHVVDHLGAAAVLLAAHGGVDDDHVLVAGAREVLAEQDRRELSRSELANAGDVDPFIGEETHGVHRVDDRAVPRVADQLAVHRADLAGVGVGQRGQAARGMSGFHAAQAGHVDRLDLGEAGHLGHLEVAQGRGVLDVLVDEAVLGEGEHVVHRRHGLLRQAAVADEDLVGLVQLLHAVHGERRRHARAEAHVRQERHAGFLRLLGELELLQHDVGVAAQVHPMRLGGDGGLRQLEVEEVGHAAHDDVAALGELLHLARVGDVGAHGAHLLGGQELRRGGQRLGVAVDEDQLLQRGVLEQVEGAGAALHAAAEDEDFHCRILAYGLGS